MHCVAAEPSDVDAVIVENVAIEAIIMPHFLVLLAFQVILEDVKEASILAKVIDEYFWAVAEIQFRPREK